MRDDETRETKGQISVAIHSKSIFMMQHQLSPVVSSLDARGTPE